MSEDDIEKMQADLAAAKTANAHLFIALEAVGKLVFDVSRHTAAQLTRARDAQEAEARLRATTLELDVALKAAYQCIWDENGEPR